MRCAWLACLWSFCLTCSLATAEETRIEGDDALRQLVLDAIATNKALLTRGRWEGSVTLLRGCMKGRDGRHTFMKEMRGDLELIWQGENTWARYQYHDINRFPPLTDATRHEELFIDRGRSHCITLSIILFTQ